MRCGLRRTCTDPAAPPRTPPPPQNGKKDHYRFKAQVKASCSSSPLYIKFRVRVSGE